jgi:hypothetical protein
MQVLQVFFHGLAVDKYVIKENQDQFPQVVRE